MREADLERLFATEVRHLGGTSFKLAPTVTGIPDRLAVLPGGRLALVELKTKAGRLSPAQHLLHSRLRTLGVAVAVLYGEDEVRRWCRERFADFDTSDSAATRKSASAS